VIDSGIINVKLTECTCYSVFSMSTLHEHFPWLSDNDCVVTVCDDMKEGFIVAAYNPGSCSNV
jgi:hypothetical protein